MSKIVTLTAFLKHIPGVIYGLHTSLSYFRSVCLQKVLRALRSDMLHSAWSYKDAERNCDTDGSAGARFSSELWLHLILDYCRVRYWCLSPFDELKMLKCNLT